MLRFIFFIPCAVFMMGFFACEQPNLKKSRDVGSGETNPELDSNELDNIVRAVVDNAGDQLTRIMSQTTVPLFPTYTARGNKDATELIIQPNPVSEGATVVVKIDGEPWGTYKKNEGWKWPTPPTETETDPPEEEDPLDSTDTDGTGELETSTSEVDEPARTNKIPFGSICIIEMAVTGATNPIKRVYTYTVSPYVQAEDGNARQQDLITGRVTGNLASAFLGSIYAGDYGAQYALREVQALNTQGEVVGSTTMQNGVMSGRYFKLPIMGLDSSVLSGVTYRAVFTKSNLAPHYSYPSVVLKEFAATEAEATADKPFVHYIFPEEVNFSRTAVVAAHTGKWLVNGVDTEVPEAGTITSITLDAAAAVSGVKIGLFRNAKAGTQAMKVLETPPEGVTTTAGGAADPQNTFEVNWEVSKGDKIGVMSTTAGYIFVNPRTNTNTTILIDAATFACTAPTNLAAIGVGYTFEPQVTSSVNNQFMELPVTNAVIPVGGKDSFLGMSAETILRDIGVANSAFSLRSNYMLMKDVHLSATPWTPMGRERQNAFFNGRFYGNGHTISNLRLKTPDVVSGENVAGFLGYMQGRVEYATGLSDVNFVVDTSQELVIGTAAHANIGVAAGRIDRGYIKNVHVRGDEPNRPLKIRHEGATLGVLRMGGIVGLYYRVMPGELFVTECSNSLDMYVTFGRIISANDDNSCVFGGLMGSAYAGTDLTVNVDRGFIKDCYNDGNLTLNFTGGYTETTTNNARNAASIGGITGKLFERYAYIENCYSTGKLTVLHGTLDGDTLNDDGHGASLLGGIVGWDGSSGPATANTNTFAHVKYNYAAGSIVQKGRVSRRNGTTTNYLTDTSFIGGLAGYNGAYNFATSNAIFMPNLRYPPYGNSYRQRVAPNMAINATNVTNNVYGAIVIDLYTSSAANINVTAGTPASSGRPAGVLNPAGNNGKAHGDSTNLADFTNQAKYEALGWRFNTNPAPLSAGETEAIPGKHWHWKMAAGADYPFPILWWQAKHIGSTAGTSPDTGAKYQWWETTLPAINEEWAENPTFNNAAFGTLNRPHSFPEGAGGN